VRGNKVERRVATGERLGERKSLLITPKMKISYEKHRQGNGHRATKRGRRGDLQEKRGGNRMPKGKIKEPPLGKMKEVGRSWGIGKNQRREEKGQKQRKIKNINPRGQI